MGGIEYDSAAEVESATKEAVVLRGTTRDVLHAGPWGPGFGPLVQTAGEVNDIAELFAKTFESAEARVLSGHQASREALEAHASQVRFLHLATHGFFAPESIASIKDDRSHDAKRRFASFATLENQVRGLAPMELCGLAFAGANLEPDKSGFIAGVMTAEEISKLDLRGCELVVLSACDTNVGVRRAGQGIASLQQAVYAAGARASLTSLWKVTDRATRALMVDFYRRMWVEKKPKRQALFEAQETMRMAKDELARPKFTTRDWAAWVLVGEG